MKAFFRILLFGIFSMTALNSCRTEETITIIPPAEEVLSANSSVAGLMQNTATKDGSQDNILDYANCFSIKLPINVKVNSENITISTEEDYKIVEFIFDDSDDDVDELIFTFPIVIILDDFSEKTVNNTNELLQYSNNCNGENEYDEDIECLDFKYPITASLFNSNNEMIDKIVLNSDKNLFEFIKSLDNYDLVSIDFPIEATLLDGTLLIVNNMNELETTIKAYEDICDEDDDYDYNDDDCNTCNIEALTNILTNCDGWVVDKLKRYSYDYDDAYYNYTFNFNNNGTVTAYYYSNTYNGTWIATGMGNNLKVVINIPDLPYCNNDWILHEIAEYTETKIDFRVGDDDRMRYKNNCN